MSFLHPGLLYGLLLAGIPVALHFLMRSRPKRYDFPALRLLEQIRKQNVQRLRLRHVGLLLLRILVLVAIVLAVARPTLPAANYSLSAGEWLRGLLALAAVASAWWGARRYWVAIAPATVTRSLRQNWLNVGSLAALALFWLLLVGWPYQRRLSAEIQNPGDQRNLNLPVAAVLLFDVSASMGYRHENQTRLEVAYELAGRQVAEFTAQSRIAIADNATATPFNFLNSTNAAATRLQRTEGTQTHDRTFSLNDRILSAISLQRGHRQQITAEGGAGEGDDRYLREIYIYTDRTQAAWTLTQAERLRSELEQAPWLRIYLIDVGVRSPVNYALSRIDLPRERAVQGALIRVTADVSNESEQSRRLTTELFLNDATGSEVKRDQQSLELEPAETAQVTFTFPADRIGALQGEIRLRDSDPLESDNRLPFTVQVTPRPLILLVSETAQESFVWQEALAPADLVTRGVHQYAVRWVTPRELTAQLNAGNAAAEVPAAIFLLNVSRLSAPVWNSLEQYVSRGGGLGVVLGASDLDAVNYRESDQLRWLPAVPTVHTRSEPEPLATIEVLQQDHPVFAYLQRVEALGLFSTAGARRFWKTDLAAHADVLARFQDEERTPAVVAGIHERGRLIVISTAVDLQGAARQNNWSELARLGWIYTAWADQVTRFLLSPDGSPLNREVGASIRLVLPDTLSQEREVLLQLPGFAQRKVSLPFRGELVTVTTRNGKTPEPETSGSLSSDKIAATQTGNYRIVSLRDDSPDFGFSLRLPDQETRLQPVSDAELDELFGPGRWQLARSYDELERTVLLGRIGKEAYPLLVSLLFVFFVGEHLAANLFYGRSER